MKIANRKVDIEVTNRCNATCDFCPREATPKQGFMSDEHFDQVIARIFEVDTPENIELSMTGRGEPTLHPKIVAFTQKLTDHGFNVSITSNGSRLSNKLSEDLLNAGLKKIHLSVSDLGADYNKIYGLNFDDVMARIDNFIKLAKGKCFIQATVVRHRGNKESVDQTIAFWEAKKIDRVHVTQEENRAGLIESEFSFQDNTPNREKSIQILRDRGLTDICSSPFFAVFFGWEGNYNLCCQDWEKTVHLGSIFDFSIEEIDTKKLAYVEKHYGVCANCSLNPINDLEKKLSEIQDGEGGKFALANKLKNLSNGRQSLREMREILDASGYQSKIITSSR